MSETRIRPALSFDLSTNHTSGAGDYVGIDEGNNGPTNHVHAVYAKTLGEAGAFILDTEFDANIYCLVVSTNPARSAKTVRQAAC